jgi:uronate dehydrogenase
MSPAFDTLALTGAAGRLGGGLRPLLRTLARRVILIDRVPIAQALPGEEGVVSDLSDLRGLTEVLTGVQAIVHFAGHPREADWSTILASNVAATAWLWEAALAAGVERIVYASSNHAVGFAGRSERIDAAGFPRPDSRYGVSKVFMEATARMYADKYGLKAFGIRIGHCAPRPSDARMLSHWIHPEDLAALVRIGLEASYDCELVYGASSNQRSWWDNRRAEALGYRPRHSADPYIDELSNQLSGHEVAERYQGGSFAAEGYRGDPERPSRAA